MKQLAVVMVISTAGRTAEPVARTTQRGGDGDNEEIPQSVGGDDNVDNIESGDSKRNVHGDWV